jgi:hypothetical protein
VNTIGTCSKCGGPVQLPQMWGGQIPPIPRCAKCGATAKNPYGPVIETEGGEDHKYGYSEFTAKKEITIENGEKK